MRATLSRARDRGATSLELAIIAPVFLLLIFFTIQVGLWVYGRTVAVQAAREGVSQLRLAEDVAEFRSMKKGTEQYVVHFAGSVGQQGLTHPKVTSLYDADAGRVSVTVSGEVMSLVPGITLSTSAEASGTIEKFLEPEPVP